MKRCWVVSLCLLISLTIAAPMLGVSLSTEQPWVSKVMLPARTMKTINVVAKKPVVVKVLLEADNQEVGTITIGRIERYAVILDERVRISIQRSGRKMMLTNEGSTSCWLQISQHP